jgi:hypothetical protein
MNDNCPEMKAVNWAVDGTMEIDGVGIVSHLEGLSRRPF